MMAALANLDLERRSGGRVVCLANEVHGSGNVTRTAEAALTTRHLLVKKGTADGEVLVCGATDQPLGVCTDEPGIDEPGNVALLGCADGTLPMVAGKAIAVGAEVSTLAGGKVTDATTASTYKVGVALTPAAGNNEVIEVAHCYPVSN